MIELETQALVIGSGFGGAVAASRLVERGYRVTMLERGPWRNTLPVASMNVRQTEELPIKGWWHLIRNGVSSVNDWRFTGKRGIGLTRKAGTFEVNNQPNVFSVCTSQVGGGSLVWAGAVARPYREDYWENRAEGVSEAILAPHFERVYQELGSSVTGEAPEIPDNWAHTWSAVEELDFSSNDTLPIAHRLPGRKENRVPGWGIVRKDSTFRDHLSLGCLDGSKASTDSIYIGPALAKGMTLLASCEAMSISRSDTKDGGYRVVARRTDTGETFLINCEKLILGAGTFNTLRLLFEAQARGALEPMPALGQGISGNGDEMSLMWNVRKSGQNEPRRGLACTFHLRDGRQDLEHAFIEMDLPDYRWPIFTAIARALQNSLVLVSMGIDASNGRAQWKKDRLEIDFDPSQSDANLDGERENRTVASLLGFKALFSPKRITVHPSGGARVGKSAQEGVVNGCGEVWGNRGLHVVDAAAIPEAPGTPPSLNIAAWASHVGACMDDAPNAADAVEAAPIVTSPLEPLHPNRLSLLFSLMPKPVVIGVGENVPPTGVWRVRCVQKFSWFTPWRRPRSRDFNFESKECLPKLVTLTPQGEPDFKFALANAWDGSGLAWQWRGRIDSRHVEVQMRSLGNGDSYLGPVHVDGKFFGWYEMTSSREPGAK
jgi:cholesterol oxidase